MHRFLARGLAAVALVATGTVVSAADPPADSRSLLARMNPFATDPPAAPGPRLRPSVGPLSQEATLAAVQAEKDAYTRRLDVCHRLKEIAFQTNDEQLEAKANELEKVAHATYRTRVSRLGVKSGGPAPTIPSAADALDRTLGTGIAVTPLTPGKSAAPAKPGNATAKANTFKEVAP
jgi:hypothetical protein